MNDTTIRPKEDTSSQDPNKEILNQAVHVDIEGIIKNNDADILKDKTADEIKEYTECINSLIKFHKKKIEYKTLQEEPQMNKDTQKEPQDVSKALTNLKSIRETELGCKHKWFSRGLCAFIIECVFIIGAIWLSVHYLSAEERDTETTTSTIVIADNNQSILSTSKKDETDIITPQKVEDNKNVQTHKKETVVTSKGVKSYNYALFVLLICILQIGYIFITHIYLKPYYDDRKRESEI